MNERRRDTIRRRSSVLDAEQTGQTDAVHTRRLNRSRAFRKLVPLLMFLVIALLIAKQEIPALDDAWERLVSPGNWQARQVCQQTAIAGSEDRDFVRILKPGRVHRTTDGVYIDRLVIGEPGQSGDETPVEYSCYVDGNGKLAKLNRSEDSQ